MRHRIVFIILGGNYMRTYLNVATALLTASLLLGSCPAAVFAEAGSQPAEAVEAESAAAEAAEAEGFEDEEVFAEWNPDAPALNVLTDYVEDITDEDSDNYIPVENRIAVFDMDGTLYAELFPTYLEYYALAWRILKDPTIHPDAEMLEVGRTIRDSALDGSFPEDMPMQHAIQAARAYAGMTLDEFSDFVTEILLRDADGFEGMTYGEAFYQPMIEVVEYLEDNDFTVYVVSGSDRFLCRTLLEGTFDLPYSNIIGMDDAVTASGQAGKDGLDYLYTSDDTVIRSDKLLIKNLKMNKVAQIVRDIGQQPVLSFGNTSGDTSMHNYTMFHNPYKSLAFMLVADDPERDYAKPEKAAQMRAQWEEAGYQVISMKNDFRNIYPEGVVKTGSFHWAEELSEDLEPADVLTSDALDRTAESAEITDAAETDTAAETEAPAGAEETDQFTLYLGTNDKDTGKPVYTQDECKERLKAILLDMVGGYTIYEAEGGWKNEDGTASSEHTYVIYITDVTADTVHEVARELIKEFNQSSILIETSKAAAEFYSGE